MHHIAAVFVLAPAQLRIQQLRLPAVQFPELTVRIHLSPPVSD